MTNAAAGITDDSDDLARGTASFRALALKVPSPDGERLIGLELVRVEIEFGDVLVTIHVSPERARAMASSLTKAAIGAQSVCRIDAPDAPFVLGDIADDPAIPVT